MDKVTFSFGKNWKEYVNSVDAENIDGAKRDITNWLGEDTVSGKSVADIGSGSGIHSYCFHLLGANSIFSFDYDMNSVEATNIFWEKAGKPSNWTVTQGSVLEEQFMSKIPESDIVYSWGVLHHTGDMWNAIKNAASLVKAGGFFFISIYLPSSFIFRSDGQHKRIFNFNRFAYGNAFRKEKNLVDDICTANLPFLGNIIQNSFKIPFCKRNRDGMDEIIMFRRILYPVCTGNNQQNRTFIFISRIMIHKVAVSLRF